ncbi:MAG: 30S ribosomal protein S11 [bacterium]
MAKSDSSAKAHGIAHIKSTYNNTVITITDPQGNTLTTASGGSLGFSGTRKGTPYAAQLAAEECGEKAQDKGIDSLEVKVKGPGSGREAAVRAFESLGIEITNIKDVTPKPHNGCKPKKRRRL